MVFCHKSHDGWIIKHSLHQGLHILADCVNTRTDMDRSDLPLLWFFNNTDEKLTQMRYGNWINKITEVVDIGFGHTEVSRNTRVEAPFCWRMWIYLVVSTWEILTWVLGIMTSVAVGNCRSSGADTVGAGRKKTTQSVNILIFKIKL